MHVVEPSHCEGGGVNGIVLSLRQFDDQKSSEVMQQSQAVFCNRESG